MTVREAAAMNPLIPSAWDVLWSVAWLAALILAVVAVVSVFRTRAAPGVAEMVL